MSIKSVDPTNGRASKRRKVDHSEDDDLNKSSEQNGSSNGSESDSGAKPPKAASSHTSRRTSSKRSLKTNSQTITDGTGPNKSSLLALQISDLLAETTPAYEKKLRRLTVIVDRLKELIEGIPALDATTLPNAERLLKESGGVAIPYQITQTSSDVNYKFEYRSPELINLGGCLAQRLSINANDPMILTLTIPRSVFQDKDYLNHRAFRKRAFYLAYVTQALRKAAKEEFEFFYAYMDGNELLPILEITPKDTSESKKQSRHLKIFLSPIFPADSFSYDKTQPDRNCVRSVDTTANETQKPTPFYNSCLQSLASNTYYEELVTHGKMRCSAFADICRLGQIWLQQRGFGTDVSSGGFGQWEWTLMCSLFLETGGHNGQALFSDRYSSVQLFKAMLQVLSGRDFSEPMVLRDDKFKLPKSSDPMLYDCRSGVNILYKMSSSSYKRLRQEAQMSLIAVNSKADDNFDATFITHIAEPMLKFDELYSITIPIKTGKSLPILREQSERLYDILIRGLGDRSTILNISWTSSNSWTTSKMYPTTKVEPSLEVSLVTNPDTVSRLVDRGPSADDKDETADFRKFWGDKSELRRFKDGTISESLVWSANKPVTLQILEYLLQLHFKVPSKLVSVNSQDLEASELHSDAPVKASDAFKVIGNRFQELSSMLHQLEDLPLPIRSVMPADAALRSATLHSPLSPSTSEAIDILIQFDSSNRWPDSLPAIQHTKIAFLIKLGDLISERNSSITTRIGIENTSSAITGYFNTSYLDIIYPSPGTGLSPICFRTRIYHDRELHLIQTALADKSLHGADRDTLSKALASHRANFIAKPTHTTTIRGLCTRFPPLSPTIRLLKKWTSCHLLLRHTPPELLETIAAHIFLRPAPWTTPGSATTAFLRCLHLLSRWDWAITPLIIDLSFSQDMPETERTEIATRFEAWRKLDPNMNTTTWFVGTSVDPTGTVFSQSTASAAATISATGGNSGGPSKVVAGRITALAKAAMDLVKQKGTGMLPSDWKSLFVSPLGDFDFLIHLKSAVVGSRNGSQAGSSGDGGGGKANGVIKFKNFQVQEQLDDEKIGYDPVELFVNDLEKAFGNVALFFYDNAGGRKVVAGLWRPNVLGKREWRVRLGYSTIPVAEKKKDGKKQRESAAGGKEDEEAKKGYCEINKKGILAEMAILGDGIIKDITVKQ